MKEMESWMCATKTVMCCLHEEKAQSTKPIVLRKTIQLTAWTRAQQCHAQGGSGLSTRNKCLRGYDCHCCGSTSSMQKQPAGPRIQPAKEIIAPPPKQMCTSSTAKLHPQQTQNNPEKAKSKEQNNRKKDAGLLLRASHTREQRQRTVRCRKCIGCRLDRPSARLLAPLHDCTVPRIRPLSLRHHLDPLLFVPLVLYVWCCVCVVCVCACLCCVCVPVVCVCACVSVCVCVVCVLWTQHQAHNRWISNLGK